MVGHSHLVQVLRNFLNGAKCQHPSLKRVVDKDGRLSLQLLGAMDQPMAYTCKRGLSIELLSFKLEKEQGPSGVALVQMTLNDAHTIAMSQHEIQALRHLEEVILTTEASLAAKHNHVELWRKKCSEGGFASLAMADCFPQVVDLVVSTCKGPWLKRMCDFHDDMINASTRRITFANIGALSHIPLTYPWVRHACFKKSYDKPSKQEDRVCTSVSPGKLKELASADKQKFLAQAETVLQRLHEQYAETGALEDLKDRGGHENLFLVVDMSFAKTLLNSKKDTIGKDLQEAEREAEKMIRNALGPKGRSRLPPALVDLAVNQEKTAKQGTASVQDIVPGPLLIKYSGSSAIGSQPALVITRTEETVDIDWVNTLNNMTQVDVKKAEVIVALNRLSNLLPSQQDLVIVRGKSDLKGLLQVRSKRVLEKGELKLAPLVQSMGAIGTRAGGSSALILPGEASVVIQQSVNKREDSRFLPPFWLVRRTEHESEGNLVLKDVEFSQISTVLDHDAGVGNPSQGPAQAGSRVDSLILPVLTNTSKIAAGEELVLFCEKFKAQVQERQARNQTVTKKWQEVKRGSK